MTSFGLMYFANALSYTICQNYYFACVWVWWSWCLLAIIDYILFFKIYELIHDLHHPHPQTPYHNPSLGLTTKVRACKGASQEWTEESHFMLPGV
jgi:hypothetical protein